jgi:hypothetical protein
VRCPRIAPERAGGRAGAAGGGGGEDGGGRGLKDQDAGYIFLKKRFLIYGQEIIDIIDESLKKNLISIFKTLFIPVGMISKH